AMAVPEAAFSEAEEIDPTIKDEKAGLQKLKDQMKAIEENTGNPYREPAYIQLSQRVRTTQKTIDERKSALRPEVEKRWRKKVKADLDLKVNALEAEIAGLSGQESKLKVEVDNLSKEIQKLSIGTRADENLQAEIDRLRKFVDDVDKQLQTARYD